MLEETKKSCLYNASLLGDYQHMPVDILADGLCDAKDSDDAEMANRYTAALLLRFWNKIDQLRRKSPNIGLDYEDFFGWLWEAIEYACKYRAWRNPEKHVNAQQAINQCIETIRLQHYYEMNLDKHRANYNMAYLDAPIAEDGEAVSLADTLVAEESEENYSVASHFDAETLIKQYAHSGKLVDAILLDTIAFHDVAPIKTSKRVVKYTNDEGETIKYTEHSSEFWPYLLVRNINDISESYVQYFVQRYSVPVESFTHAFNKLRAANNQKIYRWLSRTKESLASVLASV